MPSRFLVLPALLTLLAGCGSQPSEPPTAPVELSTAPTAQRTERQPDRRTGRQRRGAGPLEVDRRDQPDRLLSNVQLKGRDGELPFILQFNPDAFPAGQRVELRGRVTRGQLIMRLPPRTISSAASRRSDRCSWFRHRERTGAAAGRAARTAGRCPPGRRDAAGHRAAPLADRCGQHGSRLQPRGNPAHSRRATLLVFLLGQRAGPGPLAGRAPDWVRGKRVLDFGAGSGVAAIAAAKAGAAEVVACDLDPLALAACRANAALNGVELRYSQDFFGEADRFDLILVADVLYDRANLPLLDQFLSRGREALVADSRVRDRAVPAPGRTRCVRPDLAEPAVSPVSLYHATR